MMSMQKLVVEVRINEGTTKGENPHVPYSPEEIADQAIDCWRQGASVVHYHARAPKTGAPSSGRQRSSIDRILAAESSKTRWTFGRRSPGARRRSTWSIGRSL